MLSLLPLLLLLLNSAVASDGPIDGGIFLEALEDLASKSLGVQEIQVCQDFFFINTKADKEVKD